MIALLLAAFAQDAAPTLTPPAEIVAAGQFVEPIKDRMSARTLGKVTLPGLILLEWGNMASPPPLGSFVDIWTKRSRGPCTLAQRVPVVLTPDAGDEDLKHAVPVLRVTPDQLARLQAAPYAAWTLRTPEDSRQHAALACP